MKQLFISLLVLLLLFGCKKDNDSTPCQEQLMGTWIETYEKLVSDDFTDWGGDPATTTEVSLDTTKFSVIYLFETNIAQVRGYENGTLVKSDSDPVSYTCDEIVNNNPLITMKYYFDSANTLRLETAIGVKSSDPDYPNPNEVRYIYSTIRLVKQ